MVKEHPLIKIEEYIVPQTVARIRLSDFPAGTFRSILSRKGFKKAIKSGLVKVNSETAFTADYICGGEIIEIFQNTIQIKKPNIDLNVNVHYEDDFLAIVHKPAGIVVSGNKKFTLENALQNNVSKTKQKDALPRPEPAHRLDYPTSGLLLVGKTSSALIALNAMFEAKEIHKTYHAITVGYLKNFGIIETPIQNRVSKTEFTVMKTKESRKYGNLNLVELTPFTGRKHQLRIHLSSIGASILGDRKYCGVNQNMFGNGLFLHASGLRFIHPITLQEIDIKAELPKKFQKFFPDNRKSVLR